MHSPRVSIAALLFVVLSASASHSLRAQASSAVSSEQLNTLVKSRFGVAPSFIEIHSSSRVEVVFNSAPWADSSDAVQYDRSYDVAKFVWDRYGASRQIDTLAVRTTFVPAGGGPGEKVTVQFYFYPAQLKAQERPTLAPGALERGVVAPPRQT